MLRNLDQFYSLWRGRESIRSWPPNLCSNAGQALLEPSWGLCGCGQTPIPGGGALLFGRLFAAPPAPRPVSSCHAFWGLPIWTEANGLFEKGQGEEKQKQKWVETRNSCFWHESSQKGQVDMGQGAEGRGVNNGPERWWLDSGWPAWLHKEGVSWLCRWYFWKWRDKEGWIIRVQTILTLLFLSSLSPSSFSGIVNKHCFPLNAEPGDSTALGTSSGRREQRVMGRTGLCPGRPALWVAQGTSEF